MTRLRCTVDPCRARFRWSLDYFRHLIDAHGVTPWR
jgi:hypothetical protein